MSRGPNLTSTLAIFLGILTVIISTPLEQPVFAITAYDSGYDHGCSDAQAGGHPYLDTPGKGPTHHTTGFMQGYNDGYEACANNQPSNNPSTPSSHPRPQKPVVGNPIQALNNDQVVFGLVLAIVIALTIYAIKKAVKRGTHKERRDFSDLIKESVLKKQNHRCAYCKRILNVVDWHHKNGDRSDNSESNCQALCPNCHATKTRRK